MSWGVPGLKEAAENALGHFAAVGDVNPVKLTRRMTRISD
jgi:hypothetical protein